MPDIGKTFLDQSIDFLSKTYLPKIEQSLEPLTDEDIWWRPNENSNSIGNLILHLSGNVRQWIISGIGGKPDKRERQKEFDERKTIPKQELLVLLRSTVEEASGILASLDPARLPEERTFQHKELSVFYAVYHVVEHFSMHTGQIIQISKQLSGKDLKFYDVSKGTPVEKWRNR